MWRPVTVAVSWIMNGILLSPRFAQIKNGKETWRGNTQKSRLPQFLQSVLLSSSVVYLPTPFVKCTEHTLCVIFGRIEDICIRLWCLTWGWLMFQVEILWMYLIVSCNTDSLDVYYITKYVTDSLFPFIIFTIHKPTIQPAGVRCWPPHLLSPAYCKVIHLIW